MMAAFAVGCMDKDNFVQFKEYMNEGGDLPKDELGELQNIIAMIPIILDLETPDPGLKDNVAKKLIGMKDEIKTKIREEKQKTIATKITKSAELLPSKEALDEAPSPQKEELEPEPKPKTVIKQPTKYPDAFRSTKKMQVPEDVEKNASREMMDAKNQTAEQPQSLFAPKQTQTVPEPTTEIKPEPLADKTPVGFVGWIALMLTIILFTILGYFTYSSIDSINRKTAELEDKLNALRSEQATSTNFVNNYISLIEFFNYNDVTVTNLKSPNADEKASAKVLLAFNEKEGLVQFKNVKALLPNQGYQIWMVSKGQSYSLGVYTPSGTEYMRVTAFPFIPKEQVDMIKVTIESNTGSPTPSIQNYLVGSFSSK